MNLETLSLFVDVARQGSFASVARDRGIEPSSVSRTVAVLEAELGVRLLQRTTRSMRVTEAGDILLARATHLIAELQRLRDDAASLRCDPVGALRLTASVALGQMLLIPCLPALRAAFPRLRLELVLTDANLDLVEDRIDLAIRLGPSHRGDVAAIKLFATRYHVVASPSYVRAHGRLQAPAALRDRDCVLLALPEFRTRWRFRPASGGRVEEVPVRGDVMVSTVLGVVTAARAGLGPALLPDWLIADDLVSGLLVDLFPEHHVTATKFETAAWVLYPSEAQLPRKTELAIAFLRQHLRGTSAQGPRGNDR